LSKETVVLCEDEQIDGSIIGVFARWYYEQRWLLQVPPVEVDNVSLGSANLRMNKWEWSSRTFLDILNMFRDMKATDPRDKVYALLGLYQPNHHMEAIWNSTLLVDYEKSWQEVIFDAIVYCVLENNLHFLSSIDHDAVYLESKDIPSWMPRWDQSIEDSRGEFWCENSSMSIGIREESLGIDSKYSGKLKLRGYKLDSVTSITDTCWLTLESLDQTSYDWIYDQLVEIMSTRHNMEVYHEAMKRLAVTLTGGHLVTGGTVEDRVYFDRIDEEIGAQYMADFYAVIKHFFPDARIKRRGVKHLPGHLEPFMMLIREYCFRRRFFRTGSGCIGLGPECMRENDTMVILDGGKILYVLRPFDDGEYAFLGECFVYDFMDLYVLERLSEYGFEEEDTVLR
jgi:hypothetical protein